MSKTMAPGVVSLQHWERMAVQMNEILKELGKGQRSGKNLPAGVFAEALRFLESVSEQARYILFGRIPSNPPASIQNYNYAYNIFATGNFRVAGGGVRGHFSDASASVNMVILAQFIRDLAEPHDLTEEEMKAAKTIAHFFYVLGVMAGNATGIGMI